QEEHGGQDGPRDLEAGVAVDLHGLGPVVAVAVAPHEEDDADLDEHEHGRRDPERQVEQPVDLPADRALRLQRRLWGVLGAGGHHEADADDQRDPDQARVPHLDTSTDGVVSTDWVIPTDFDFLVIELSVSSSCDFVSGPVIRSTMRPLRSMNTL